MIVVNEYLAISAISPAARYTIRRFWPMKPGQMVRLLIISFFIGAWISSPVPDISYGNIPFLMESKGDIIANGTSMIAAVMTGLLLIILVYAFFSSIFQFIFVDYLSSETKQILPSLRVRTGMGVRLLGFYLVTIAIIGICAVIAIMTIAVPVLSAHPDNPAVLYLALLYALAGLLILIVPVWMLTIITTDFIVPVMIVHTCGIIRGWLVFLQEIRGKWDEMGIYLIIKVVITVITGIILGILLVGLTEGLGFSSFMIIPGLSSSEKIMNTGFILPFLLMAVISLIIMTPVVTFLRYYALVFLHLLSSDYSLLPDEKSSDPGTGYKNTV